ncbi:MAG: hypothetical protein RMY64_09370 [Nostoc sp. DedQUE08]|uniref:hypothetical protein n=1 Tax=Nostoc sp. DedQUE04 TaxID=3075390 RepID=UPI002AD3701A|nr:hypothetical protein [Nostoc sp. DedQUE04]MDZ8065837.1 hypothetical protein [Nostoc sp. DedQUE08]MDZ8136905.1 hypothetical protein [Nostoc sp. DedQUE04]
MSQCCRTVTVALYWLSSFVYVREQRVGDRDCANETNRDRCVSAVRIVTRSRL